MRRPVSQPLMHASPPPTRCHLSISLLPSSSPSPFAPLSHLCLLTSVLPSQSLPAIFSFHLSNLVFCSQSIQCLLSFLLYFIQTRRIPVLSSLDLPAVSAAQLAHSSADIANDIPLGSAGSRSRIWECASFVQSDLANCRDSGTRCEGSRVSTIASRSIST